MVGLELMRGVIFLSYVRPFTRKRKFKKHHTIIKDEITFLRHLLRKILYFFSLFQKIIKFRIIQFINLQFWIFSANLSYSRKKLTWLINRTKSTNFSHFPSEIESTVRRNYLASKYVPNYLISSQKSTKILFLKTYICSFNSYAWSSLT